MARPLSGTPWLPSTHAAPPLPLQSGKRPPVPDMATTSCQFDAVTDLPEVALCVTPNNSGCLGHLAKYARTNKCTCVENVVIYIKQGAALWCDG